MNSYLFSNFHSVSEANNSLNLIHNRYAFSTQLDYNGCGLRSAVKRNTLANFYAVSPTLPYFVNSSRLNNRFAAKNCLISCKYEDNNLLISTEKNKIVGLLIDDNGVNSGDSTPNIEDRPHLYRTDESVSDGPFRYCCRKTYDLYVDEEVTQTEDFRPIFELKVDVDYQDVTRIQSNSRNKICFFRFNENELDLSLDLINELKVEDFGRSDRSLFENCDTNELNHLLMSYTTSDFVDLYDLETKQIIRSLDSNEFNHEIDKEIGLYFSESHPMMFFIGHHKRLHYCDSRTRRPVLEFHNKNDKNLFFWEMFYQFLPTKLKPNQVFVATDYHIFITDWRYPKQNLIQLNHMLSSNIIRSLKSKEVVVDNTNTEILITSTFHRNCLMSFNSVENCSLSSNHLPLHVSTPKDIDKQFEKHFYRGIQLIDSTDSSGFSLALLTNLGDIFVQDFFWFTSEEELCARESDPLYKDRTYSTGPCSSPLELNEKTVKYMEVLNKYLSDLKFKGNIVSNSVHECIACSVNRSCKLEDGECLCKNHEFVVQRNTQEESVDTTTDLMTRLSKHLGPHLLDNKRKLENKDELNKTTDKYTKNIFKLWEVSPEESDDIPEDTVIDKQ